MNAEDVSRYDGIVGKDFLIQYFSDHGITEDEISLYKSWGGFDEIGNGMKGDAHGLDYAARRVEKIVAYRNITLEDLRKDYSVAPWAWPTAMCFSDIYGYAPDVISDNLKNHCGIYLCIYNNERYFFNVGKEEPTGNELEKMLLFGRWKVYTYSD
jgi:hypothetical protein